MQLQFNADIIELLDGDTKCQLGYKGQQLRCWMEC